MSKLISIVVPVFNEAEIINDSVNALIELRNQISYQVELIFVDDGSIDDTLILLKKFASKHSFIKIISFSKNFGHQMAFTAGISYSQGDAVVVIDGDLQDPPEVINTFIAEWEKGADVAYGVRISRKGETFFKKYSAELFYKFIDYMSDTKIPRNTGDFRLMDRKVVNALKNMPESARYIRGMVSWIGFNQVPIEYHRNAREAGTTKYTGRKMMQLARNGILSFSKTPLRIASITGIFTIFLALTGILYALIMRVFTSTWVEGWTFLSITIFFFGGIQMIMLGIIGEYLGIVFDESKRRPLYVIKEQYNLDE